MHERSCCYMVKYFEEQSHYLFYKSGEKNHYITFLFKCSYKNGKMKPTFQIVLALDLQNVKEPVKDFSFEAQKEAAEAYLQKCGYENYKLIREAHLVKMNDREYVEQKTKERKQDLASRSDFSKLNSAMHEINKYQYDYLFWQDYYEDMKEPILGGLDLGIQKSNTWEDELGEEKTELLTRVLEIDQKQNCTDLTGGGTMDIHDYMRLLQGCLGCYLKKRQE